MVQLNITEIKKTLLTHTLIIHDVNVYLKWDYFFQVIRKIEYIIGTVIISNFIS